MKSTFLKEDVTLLLKDISGLVTPLPTTEREVLIQQGTHYCEMLPLEYKPSARYIRTYESALQVFSKQTADAVARVAELIYERKGTDIVLVSLARAGIPVGILIKRYLERKYKIVISHYAVSIIRGRGIDKNAINYILESHVPKTVQFVDGWVGKGAIFKTLKEALADYPQIDAALAVLADPAYLTELCGTHEDILIPSSCLNCTVSGLISRSFLREDIIGKSDFHGAAYYGELLDEDRSYEFIETVEAYFDYNLPGTRDTIDARGLKEVEEIQKMYQIQDANLVKPGIGETTRVLLRRVPWKVLISNRHNNSEDLKHIYQLAQEKAVEIECCDLKYYKCCGLIRTMMDV